MNIVLKGLADARLFWKRHGALVMTIAGGVSDVASVVFSTRAGMKLNEVMKANNTDIEKAREEDSKKAVVKAYLRSFGRLAKLYAPSAACLGVSMGTRVMTYKDLKANNIALTAAASGLASKFTDYREKVKAKLGEEEENAVYKSLTEEKVKEVDPETGKTIEKTVKKNIYDDLSVPYTPRNRCWESDPYSCVSHLLTIQSYFQAAKERCGTIFLYDVLKELQYDPDMLSRDMLIMSRIYGWTGNDIISFGISDELGNLYPEVIEARNNGDLCYWLTFNCHDIVNVKSDFTKHIKVMR